MTAFTGSPKLLKGGIVLIDPATAQVQRIIALQYNPESLSRTLQVQGVLAKTAANPRNLKLELTESMLLDNVQEIIAKMTVLKKHGVGFSLDDLMQDTTFEGGSDLLFDDTHDEYDPDQEDDDDDY